MAHPMSLPADHSRRGLRWIPIVALTLGIGSLAAVASSPVEQPLPLPEIGSGELLWKSARGLVPLPVLDVDVSIEVTGIMARGVVTQRFANVTGEVIEAIYAFPLPDRAVVDDMEMRIGDRRIVAEIREKREAREVYEAAKAGGRKTALVDQLAGNLFTTSAANINPGETIEVRLAFVDEIEWVDGRFRLRFPLTFVPRYSPVPDATESKKIRTASKRTFGESEPRGRSENTAPVIPTASVRLRLESGVDLRSVESTSHAIQTEKVGAAVILSTRPGKVTADRDFVLAWEPESGQLPSTITFVEEREDGHYALVLLMPPAPNSDAGIGLPTETLFIIDVSGSMDGPSIAQARDALVSALGRLRPEDRFNIIRFNDRFDSFGDGFEQAEPDRLAAAQRWVRSLTAGGGTMIHPALEHGLVLLGRSRSTRAQRIIFLTDGAVANEQQVLETVARELGDARLHAIGIGHAPNGYLMRKLARHGRGLCEFLAAGASTENGIDRFFARLNRPVFTDLSIDWERRSTTEIYPTRLPDLHSGEPLIVSLRLDGNEIPEKIEVTGYSRSGHLSLTAPLRSNARKGSGVATRWARAKIDALTDAMHEGLDPGTVRDEVVEVGLAFNLVTRFTSLVAVEQTPTALADARGVGARGTLPRGGTDGPLRLLIGLALVVAGAATYVIGRMS